MLRTMATLTSGSGDEVVLLHHHLIGRSRAMHTRLSEPEISAQHASLLWTGAHWAVRDLGSRNGTWLDGVRLSPIESAPVSVGSVLWFGDPRHAYTLADASPPGPVAFGDAGIVHGAPEYLALPSDDDPVVLFRYEPDQGWVLSREDQSTPAVDGSIIEVAGTRWTLALPEAIAGTVDARRPDVVRPVRLLFRVSRDEEYVEISASVDGTSHPLRPRVGHYALLLLARARLEDRDGGCAETEEGWVYTPELARRMAIDRNRLYVILHRCRKELDAVGIKGETLIEKRTTTQQIRLGVPDLQIDAL